MRLYHVTTAKKARLYREHGSIIAPVRGFDSLQAAMAWAMKVGRKVIVSFEVDAAWKLPDHHNRFGSAWWVEDNVTKWHVEFSAETDA